MLTVTIVRAEPDRSSHALLRCAAAALYGAQAAQWRTAPGTRGKPFFVGVPEVHFSISHTNGLWVCAFAARPVGLDAQARRPVHTEPLIRRCFHAREQAYLERCPDAFFALWAAKEACVKLTGAGIDEAFRAVSTVSEAGEFPSVPGACLTLLTDALGVPCCLAAYEAHTVQLRTL